MCTIPAQSPFDKKLFCDASPNPFKLKLRKQKNALTKCSSVNILQKKIKTVANGWFFQQANKPESKFNWNFKCQEVGVVFSGSCSVLNKK